MIPVAAAPPQQGPDVAVDRLDLPERDLLVAVGEDTVAMPQQELGDPAERWQRCHRSARSHVVRKRRAAPS